MGLACWLLGLREPDQVARDPLLGGLFENFVVVEALKSRFNRGETGEMYFYRDANDQEVDLLLPEGRQFAAVEIKAGATVNPDYFRGLAAWSRTYPEACARGRVVYGGDSSQARSDFPVLGWRQLGERAL